MRKSFHSKSASASASLSIRSQNQSLSQSDQRKSTIVSLREPYGTVRSSLVSGVLRPLILS